MKILGTELQIKERERERGRKLRSTAWSLWHFRFAPCKQGAKTAYLTSCSFGLVVIFEFKLQCCPLSLAVLNLVSKTEDKNDNNSCAAG